MSIDIRKAHTLSLEDAQQVADELAAELAGKFGVDYGWDGDTIVFERAGVSGEIDVNEECVHVRAQLGLALFWLQPAVEQEINRILAERFD